MQWLLVVTDAAKHCVWLNTMESAQGPCPVSEPELAPDHIARLIASGICRYSRQPSCCPTFLTQDLGCHSRQAVYVLG